MAKSLVIKWQYTNFLVPPELVDSAVKLMSEMIEVEEAGDYRNKFWAIKKEQNSAPELILIDFEKILQEDTDKNWRVLYESQTKTTSEYNSRAWKAEEEAKKLKQELETVKNYKASTEPKETI